MSHSFEKALSQSWPPAEWADLTVVVALSGGSDSVALFRAMVALKSGGAGRLWAAHLNHQLRPEADADERFVVELCDRLGVPCEVGRADVGRLACEAGEGIEATARHARYRFLEETAGRLGARFVATAHTADDQAETVLHRIIRGTGVRGLGGMSRARRLGHATLIRPLLGVRHAELQAYLEAIGQPFLSDPSNRDRRFTRNRIRLGLLPRLQSGYNPEVVNALLRLSALAGEATEVIDRLVDELFDRSVTAADPCGTEIATEALAAEPPYLVRELMTLVWRRQGWPMQAMTMAKWDELARLALDSATSGARHFPGGVTVAVSGGVMRLSKSAASALGGGTC
ncbi:MAG: tRNA lysidine(34) synthetase TilS [Planctomycetaceae bacterium]|nr:tRNA lysidine(34) synthetase TilS [Planctomycetaceae bacterium]